MLLARKLGEEGLGLYSYIFTVMVFFNLAVDFGVANFFWRKWVIDLSTFTEDIKAILGTKILIIIPATFFLLLYTLISDRAILFPMFLGYLITVLDIVRAIPLSYLNSQNAYEKSFWVNIADRIFSFGGGIIALLLGANLLTVLYILIVSKSLSLIISHFYTPILYKPNFNIKNTADIIKKGVPLFLLTFLGTLYFKIDTVMIKNLLGLSAVGYYNAVYRLIETLAILPTIISYAVFPSINALIEKREESSLGAILQTAMKYLTLTSIFIAIFFTFYSKEILHFLYGSRFIEAGSLLGVLGFTTIFLFLNTLLTYYLLAKKEEIFLTKRVVVLSIVNIIGNFILIPIFGVLGAAFSTLITEIINFVIIIYKMQLSIHIVTIAKLLLVTLGIIALFISFHPPLFYMLLGAGLLYLSISYIMKIVLISDFSTKGAINSNP